MQQKNLTLEEAADYIENATIERSHDTGHAIFHIGRNAIGASFVLVNDCIGQTAVIEANW